MCKDPHTIRKMTGSYQRQARADLAPPSKLYYNIICTSYKANSSYSTVAIASKAHCMWEMKRWKEQEEREELIFSRKLPNVTGFWKNNPNRTL